MQVAQDFLAAQVEVRVDAGQMTATPIAAELLSAGTKIIVIS